MINEKLKYYSDKLNNYFEEILPSDDSLLQKNVIDAMRYSLISNGKKIRPAIVFEMAKLCGLKDEDAVMPLAAAIEMIHTYSLIHDDLPCMDNDDMRRGKPSCHKAFGEDIALLAGDALLTLAFETAANSSNILSCEIANKAVACLAFSSGYKGMVGGQVIDLETEGKSINIYTLKKMHFGKTGMMFRCAVLLGCYAANANEKQINSALTYADNIGLIFQIIDDVLDVIADEKEFGKPIGSDKSNNKTTYATLFSIDECYNLANKLNNEGKQSLKDNFGDESDFLCDLADMLVIRKK